MSPPTANSDEVLLSDWILEWEDAQASAAPKLPEEIGAVRPDLIPELKARIAALADIDGLLFPPQRTLVGAETPQPRNARHPWPTLDGYSILAEIGRGGMGVVYQARQERLNRIVAIKAIRGGRWVSSQEVTRFKAEAKILAHLEHPGIVRIHDILEHDGGLCLVLEFVDGHSLAESSRQTTMASKAAAKLALEISTILAAVHAQGILHRDIKPANVLLAHDGRVKVTDFGLAKELTTESGNTLSGDILGSPSYMAPEQVAGNLSLISERTDVYSMGATLYELLTARPPFAGVSVVDTFAQVTHQEPTPPRQLVPSIPKDLETVCLKCLEKDPGRRYASAVHLAEDLERFLADEPVLARPVSTWERAGRWARRNPDKALFGSAALVAALALAVALTWFSTRLAHEQEKFKLQKSALNAEEARARTQEFFANFGRIRERGLSRRAGWLQANLAELKATFPLAGSDEDRQSLRTEVLRCLCSHDIRQVKSYLKNKDISCLARHPTRPLLAVGDNVSSGLTVSIRLIDLADEAAPPRTLEYWVPPDFVEHNVDGCRSLAFTPSGDRLLMGSRHGWIHVWETTSWKLVDKWQAHSDRVHGLVVDPTGELLYTGGSHSGEVKQWRLMGHELQREVKVEGEIQGLSLTKTHLAVATHTGVLVDLADFRAEPIGVKQGAVQIAPYRGGDGLLVADGWHLFEINSQSRETVRELADPRLRRAHQFAIHAVRLDSSGRFGVSTDSNSVKVWDCAAGTLIAEVQVGSGMHPVEFLGDGARFAVAASGGVQIFEIDTHPGWSANSTRSDEVRDVTLSADGKTLAEFRELRTRDNWHGSIQAGPVAALQPLSRTVSADHQSEHVLSPDGRRLLLVASNPPRLVWLNTSDMSTLAEMRCGPEARALTMDETGTRVYFTAKDDSNQVLFASALFVCDLLDPGPPRLLWSNLASEIRLSKSKILAIAAGKKWLATSSLDGQLRIHRADGSILTTLPAQPLYTSLTMDAGQSRLIAGDELGGISIFSLPDGEKRYHLAAHSGSISGLAISSDDQLLSACHGGEVRFWKLTSQPTPLEPLASLGRLSGPIHRLSASRDGQTAAILVEGESTARILNLGNIRKVLQGMGLDW